MDNPHPNGKCDNCGVTKNCVNDEACSLLCASMLSERGLISAKKELTPFQKPIKSEEAAVTE